MFASVGPLRGTPKVGQWLGWPPELTDGRDLRVRLPWPRVVVIEEMEEGFYLFRHAADGADGGDTWSQTLEEAMDQADFEFGDVLGEWRDVPPDVGNAGSYALERVGR